MGRPTIIGAGDLNAGGPPRWANGTTASVIEPFAIDKTAGWFSNENPPAAWFNWWQNKMFKLQAMEWSRSVFNWSTKLPPQVAGFLGSIIMSNPDGGAPGRLVAIEGNDVFWTDSAGTNSWSIATLVGGAVATARAKAVDSTRYIVGVDSGAANTVRVNHSVSAEAGSWIEVVIAAPAAQTVTAIGTAENSDRIIVGDSGGRIAFAVDVLSAFTSAAVQPSSLDPIQSIVHTGAASGLGWMLINSEGETFRTLDNGNTWGLTGGQPTSDAGSVWTYIAADRGAFATPAGTTRVVVAGSDNFGGARAEYSDDDGATWIPCVFGPPHLGIGTASITAMWHLGGGMWVASGEAIVGPVMSNVYLAVSTDNAANFRRVEFLDETEALLLVARGWLDACCDGERIWLANRQGQLAMSQAMAAAPEIAP